VLGAEADVSDFVASLFAILQSSTETAPATPVSTKKVFDYAEASDELLLTRVTEGDERALGWLFERHSSMLRRIAARILGDSSEAEDLVQDLFLFIHRKAAIFDGTKSSARSWIVQMAYHRAISRRRYLATRQFYSHKQVECISEQVVGAATTENDYSAEAVFGRNGLKAALATLSKDQLKTLRLCFFEGHTLAEISTKLGQPLGNVRHHYYRALDKLRKQIFASDARSG
jgi:RNA polymerase sigma-70 factor, ECF subfamily